MFLVSCLMMLGAAEESDWYFTAGAFLETSELKSDYLGTVKFNDESAFRFGLGTKLNEHWNLEFEFGTSEAYGIDSFGDPVFAEYSQSCFGASPRIRVINGLPLPASLSAMIRAVVPPCYISVASTQSTRVHIPLTPAFIACIALS